MAHQVAELVGPVAGLVIDDRGDRPLHVQGVRGERSIPLAFEDQALLAIDVGGGIEDRVAVTRVDAHVSRTINFGHRAPAGRLCLALCGPFGLERVDFAAKLPVFSFQPVQAFDHTLVRLRARSAKGQAERQREGSTGSDRDGLRARSVNRPDILGPIVTSKLRIHLLPTSLETTPPNHGSGSR